jgi:hypothetical protein
MVVAMALAGSAIAQPTVAVHDSTSCAAEQAELEKRMDLARSKGRMLLRQQLADQLATLQQDCLPHSADQGSAANIQRLEKKVRALRTELEAAEEQLRKLKGEVSR